ncbi:MAG: hypothetical protein JSR49_12405 [Proteobacteria bacterium]|nr:hypothetical protein [Pseudomonadota bacterium]
MTKLSTIEAGPLKFEIHSITGEVLDARKWAVTEVSGGGGGGAVYGTNGNVYGGSGSVSIKSTTTNHAELFIRGKDGKEHVVKLKDEDVNVRTGSWVSLFWAAPKGKDGGPYVAVINHDTDALEIITSGVEEACSSTLTVASGILAFIVMAIGFLVLFTAHLIAAWLLIAAYPGFLFWRSRLRNKFRTGVHALRNQVDGSRPVPSAVSAA